MEIQSTYKGGTLIIAISGRVDSAEAVKLQQSVNDKVNNCDHLESIIIDAAQMTYVSSMGLRVFLGLKKQIDDLTIIGVNADVYNVFKMTGMHKIITVEKSLPDVSIEGCNQVEGADDLYTLTDETMVKVFPVGTTKADVDMEMAMAKELLVSGIPTAMAFDLVMVSHQYGLVYERAETMLIDAERLGEMLRQLHEHKVDPDEEKFVSCHDNEKQHIRSLEPYLGQDAVDKLLQMLSILPDATSLLHGNLSLSDFMMQSGMPIITNFGKAGYGNPVLDLAHLYASLTEEQKGDYFDDFIYSYYDMESEETIRRNRENIIVLSLIFDFTRLTACGEPTPEAVEESKKQFEQRVADCWDEILSRLRFKMDFNEEIRRLERKKFYLDCDVDIDWIAKRLGTNRHYVSDYFNKVLHTTFNDYINNLRLEYAVHLMKEGRVPKSQILYDAGFNNDHTFRRLFKQKYGCLPSQYLKENK